MKIVHLNKNDLSGGAARAAYRLHQGLRRVGQDSTMFVESRTGDDPSVVAFARPMAPADLVRRGLRQAWIARGFKRYQKSRPGGYELFSDDRSSYAATILGQIPQAQIVNLHWIPGFVDYRSFFAGLSPATKVVWTLHDLNPLTGGCHYDLGCERYVAGCGGCPQLGSDDPRGLSHQIWERKRRVFAGIPPSRLRFVTPSRWLGEQVRRSPLLDRFSVDVIPGGLDLETFTPHDRGKVRDLLGIPANARVLLFVAESLGNTRKGFSHLIEALAHCAARVPNLVLLSLGGSKPNVDVAVPWIHLGSIDNDRFLSMVYSAADLFAICSLQDNLPNTVLEAIACGLPVVGFRVGGIPDMVRHGVNGLVVPVNDARALAGAIADVLNDPDRNRALGARSRQIAVEEYSLELHARRYAELYTTFIGNGHHHQAR